MKPEIAGLRLSPPLICLHLLVENERESGWFSSVQRLSAVAFRLREIKSAEKLHKKLCFWPNPSAIA
jgi:hypothetical protein